MTNTQAGIGSTAGLTLLSVTTDPRPVPIGGQGITIINSDSVPVNISTDNPPTPANTATIPPNGASRPVPAGSPVWIFTTIGTAVVELIPKLLNIFNPNVLTAPSTAEIIYQKTVVNSASNIIPVPPDTRTLLISASAHGNIGPNPILVTNITASGALTGQVYSPSIATPPFYNTYLLSGSEVAGSNNAFMAVPFPASLEGSVDLTIRSSDGSNSDIIVFADDLAYKEDIFYNGQMNGVGRSSAGLLLTGPARLLTATVAVLAGSVAGIIVNSNAPSIFQGTLIYCYSTTPTLDSKTITFPPNTLLANAQQISVIANSSVNVQVGLTYAYP